MCTFFEKFRKIRENSRSKKITCRQLQQMYRPINLKRAGAKADTTTITNAAGDKVTADIGR